MHHPDRVAATHRQVGVERERNPTVDDGPVPGHHVGPFRAQAPLGVLVGESDRVIRVRADNRSEFGDPVDLFGRGVGEVDDDGAVIVSGRFGKAPLERVEHKIETGIAVDVHMEQVAGVPVRKCPFGEHVGFHQPFAVMFRIWVPVRIEVRLSHLHQLGDDRPVGEQLHLSGRNRTLPSLRSSMISAAAKRALP